MEHGFMNMMAKLRLIHPGGGFHAQFLLTNENLWAHKNTPTIVALTEKGNNEYSWKFYHPLGSCILT